jgi:hypothetical protein
LSGGKIGRLSRLASQVGTSALLRCNAVARLGLYFAINRIAKEQWCEILLALLSGSRNHVTPATTLYVLPALRFKLKLQSDGPQDKISKAIVTPSIGAQQNQCLKISDTHIGIHASTAPLINSLSASRPRVMPRDVLSARVFHPPFIHWPRYSTLSIFAMM